jgi:recombination protein RecA
MSNIDQILNDFQNRFGLKPRPRKNLEVFPTGYTELNQALGIGGIPRGKTTEISGAPGSGKSVLACYLTKEAQRQGAIVLYVDAERAFDPVYAGKIGVDLSKLLICTPQTGEIAMQVIFYYLSQRLIDMVVIDSVPALLPLEELLGETRNGIQKKLITTMLKGLIGEIESSRAALVCLNQVRHCFKEGGSITPFNNIFAYYASLRIHLRKVRSIKKWRKLKGYVIEASIHKNTWAERSTATFELPVMER